MSSLVTEIFERGQSPQERATKAKINKRDYIKLRSFCTVKKTNKKTKTQPTEWETISVNHITNKGLISKIYEEFTQLNVKKPQIAN